ncbi:MAG: hypothetical protein JWM32_3150 [Verrucomicrobia bacterium]|nr:hypothetical protein [Verrucomicrobiota bacterium]
MKFVPKFFFSGAGQSVLLAVVLGLGTLVVLSQRKSERPAPLPRAQAKPLPEVALPKTLTREGVRFPKLMVSAATPGPSAGVPVAAVPAAPKVQPLGLFTAGPERAVRAAPVAAPFGRMIPCETIVALESNHLETPIVGLVTEDVWHDGRLVIPAGAEVHGRAALDRTRERLGAEGTWRIVWRTRGPANGTELAVQGLALDREYDAGAHTWGDRDGSAGLRGTIVKRDSERELKLFAASFLGAATAALQETRTTVGLLGEASQPAATAKNAALAGTGAVLREYVQGMRDGIAKDGFYLRVPAGKPFYLYVTEKLVVPTNALATASALNPSN